MSHRLYKRKGVAVSRIGGVPYVLDMRLRQLQSVIDLGEESSEVGG